MIDSAEGSCITEAEAMASQTEVRESHEQFSAAWSLYARSSGVGEVVEVEGAASRTCGHRGSS